MLLNRTTIDELPETFLRSIGAIVATFDARTQDSGNVSFGVEIDGERFFVKSAGDPDDPVPPLRHPDRVALLRNAVDVYESVRHPAMATLRNVIESPWGPMLVYDWCEGELLGAPAAVRDDPGSAYQRFRKLPAEKIITALDTIYDLHTSLARAGWIAVDFYDGCLIYDFTTDRLRLIDLDMYHPGPLRNDRGRMFGSTRFMAPEEFELGATIDERTTVFSMGRTALLFLGDGMLDAGAFRGSRAMFDVVVKACSNDRAMRFESMGAFNRAWREARSNY